MRARATCPLDCPDACSLLLTLEEGRLLRVEGDPRHPITQGFACAKTYRYPERVRERLLYPLRRVGRKGEGKFVRVSWEEALDEIAKLGTAEVDLAALIAASLVPAGIQRCKIVLSGKIDRAVVIKGLVPTKGARAAIEAAGGRVE